MNLHATASAALPPAVTNDTLELGLFQEFDEPLESEEQLFSSLTKRGLLSLEGDAVIQETNYSLNATQRERLSDLLHKPLEIVTSSGITRHSLYEIMRVVYAHALPLDNKLVGSFVWKILGWEFVESYFEKIGFSLPDILSKSFYRQLRDRFDTPVNDVDLRLKMPASWDRSARESFKEALPGLYASLWVETPLIKPLDNISLPDQGFEALIYGMGVKTDLTFQCVLAKTCLRRNLEDKDAPQIELPKDLFEGATLMSEVSVSTGTLPLLNAILAKICGLIKIRNPFEVNQKAWAKVVYSLMQGNILPDHDVRKHILLKALFPCAQAQKGPWLANLLLKNHEELSPLQRVPLISEACRFLLEWIDRNDMLTLSKHDIIEMVKACLKQEFYAHAALVHLGLVSLNKEQWIVDLWDLNKKNLLTKEIREFTCLAEPAFSNLAAECDLKDFLIFIVGTKGYMKAAWVLYQREMPAISLSKFWLGCMRTNTSEALFLMEESCLNYEVMEEALTHFFSRLPTRCTLPFKFLTDQLHLIKELDCKKIKSSWLFEFILYEASLNPKLLPEGLLEAAFYHPLYGKIFSSSAVRFFEQIKYIINSPDHVLLFRGEILFFRFSSMLKEYSREFAEVILEEFSLQFHMIQIDERRGKIRALLYEAAPLLDPLTLFEHMLRWPGKEEALQILVNEHTHLLDNLAQNQEFLSFRFNFVNTISEGNYNYSSHHLLFELFLLAPPQALSIWTVYFRIASKGGTGTLKYNLAALYVEALNKDFPFMGTSAQKEYLFKFTLEFSKLTPLMMSLNPHRMEPFLRHTSHNEVAKTTWSLFLYYIKTEESFFKFSNLLWFIAEKLKLEHELVDNFSLHMDSEQLRECLYKPNLLENNTSGLKILHRSMQLDLLLTEEVAERVINLTDEPALLLLYMKMLHSVPIILLKLVLECKFLLIKDNPEIFPYLKPLIRLNFQKCLEAATFESYLKTNKGMRTKEDALLEIFPECYEACLSDSSVPDKSHFDIYYEQFIRLSEMKSYSSNFKKSLVIKCLQAQKQPTSRFYGEMLSGLIETYFAYYDANLQKNSLAESLLKNIIIKMRDDKNDILIAEYHQRLFFIIVRAAYINANVTEMPLEYDIVHNYLKKMFLYQKEAAIHSIPHNSLLLNIQTPYLNIENIKHEIKCAYFQNWFHLLNMTLKEISYHENTKFHFMEFVGNQILFNIKYVPITQIAEFLKIFRRFYLISLNNLDMFNFHSRNCEIILKEIYSCGIYKTVPKTYLEDVSLLALPLDIQPLKISLYSLDKRVEAFHFVTDIYWRKINDPQQGLECSLIQMMKVLKAFPSLLFVGDQRFVRDAVLEKVYTLLRENEELTTSPNFKLYKLLNAVYPIYRTKNLAFLSLDIKKLNEFPEVFINLFPNVIDKSVLPSQFFDLTFVFLRCELQKVEAGYYYADIKEWEAYAVLSDKYLTSLYTGKPEQYKDQYLKWAFLYTEFICLEHERFSHFHSENTKLVQIDLFQKFIVNINNAPLQEKIKSEILTMVIFIGERAMKHMKGIEKSVECYMAQLKLICDYDSEVLKNHDLYNIFKL